MDNIFRSFFGFEQRERPPKFTREPENDPGLISPFKDESTMGMERFLFTQPDDISRQFDEIFANFERVFQGLGVIEPPTFEFALPGEFSPNGLGVVPVPPSSQLSPRDEMLKHPYLSVPHQDDGDEQNQVESGRPSLFGRLWSGQLTPHHEMVKEDSDIDGSVEINKLDKMFGTREEVSPKTHRGNSMFQSVSVRTHRSADGKIEETRTTVDPQGNKQTVVTRTVDDQTIRHTTKINKNGETEVTEEFFNLDEKDRGKFDEMWNNTAVSIKGQPSGRLFHRNKAIGDFQSDGSIFSRLFGFDFPGFR